MLEETLRRYQNRAIEAAQVIEELIELAREMREANARGDELGMSEDELAFYDALETNDSAVKVLGDETLRGIARELVETVAATSPSTGRCARTCGRTCAGWSGASCESTGIRRTSRRRRRRRCWNRRKSCLPPGRREMHRQDGGGAVTSPGLHTNSSCISLRPRSTTVSRQPGASLAQ